MSVQVRVRAGALVAASAVIVSGLGFGVTVGTGSVSDLRTEAAAVTVAKKVATTKKPVVKKATPTKKPVVKKTTTKATPTKKPTPKPTPRIVGQTGTATQLTMTAVSTTVTQAQFYRAVLRGTLIDTRTKKPISDQKVTLYRRVAGSTVWTPLVWDRSDLRTGRILLAVEQTDAQADYKMVFAGRSPYAASSSPVITIKRG